MIIRYLLLIFILCYSASFSGEIFEPPKYDPWYYEMEDIKIPDKFAHYYRSYIGVKIVDWKLIGLGNILYEMYDGYRGVGYSWKDNVADFLGLISSQWLSNENIAMILDWNKETKLLKLTVKIKI